MCETGRACHCPPVDGSFARPRGVEVRFTVARMALDDTMGFSIRQNLHMPPASIGALSEVNGEDCGQCGVAAVVNGAGRGERSLAWIAVVVMVEIQGPCLFLNASRIGGAICL